MMVIVLVCACVRRDYRWYGPDLIHPSEAARQIVFQRFCDHFMAPTLRPVAARGGRGGEEGRAGGGGGGPKEAMALIDAVHRDVAHRPLVAGTRAHRRHLEGALAKARHAQTLLGLDFSSEVHLIETQLRTSFDSD